jgi:hypothetical protein
VYSLENFIKSAFNGIFKIESEGEDKLMANKAED